MQKKQKDIVGGIILLALGAFFLFNQFVNIDYGNLGLLFLPLLGALFLVWGILTREGGLMIPGGILSGIGWGIFTIAGPFAPSLENEGGLFLIIFGLGFASIALFTALFADETHWWALIPGGIIAVVGTAVLFGGAMLNALEWAGKLWPLILIIVGIQIIRESRKEKSPVEKFTE